MRLKEDSHNYKASNIERKLTYSPDYPQGVDWSKAKVTTFSNLKPTKDTKRWCKGKIGVEHDYSLQVPPNDPSSIRGFCRMNICNKCGRQDYKVVQYWCKAHKVWDKHVFWDEDHTHETISNR